jgi:peptide deformylase
MSDEQTVESASVPMAMTEGELVTPRFIQEVPPSREISPEEKAYMEAAARETALVNRIVPPHTKVSRQVTLEDVNKESFHTDIQDLFQLCFAPVGLYGGAYAMHHSQIDDKDPLSVFVMNNMLVVINPVITRHSNYTRDSEEACMSFSGLKMITVQRWQKIEVNYQTVLLDPADEKKYILSEVKSESISGNPSLVFQHEIDHGNGKFIYELTK